MDTVINILVLKCFHILSNFQEAELLIKGHAHFSPSVLIYTLTRILSSQGQFHHPTLGIIILKKSPSNLKIQIIWMSLFHGPNSERQKKY